MRRFALALTLTLSGCCGPDLVPAIRLADKALADDAKVLHSSQLRENEAVIKDRLATIAAVRAALEEVLKRETD